MREKYGRDDFVKTTNNISSTGCIVTFLTKTLHKQKIMHGAKNVKNPTIKKNPYFYN